MKPKVGSTCSLTTLEVDPVMLGDPRPVMDPGAAEGIDAQPDARAADRLQVDDVAQVVHVGAQVIVAMRRGGAQRLRERYALDAREPVCEQALAASWIQPVTSYRPGRRCGGLYLKPPSSGGLCEGVMTMPSASPLRAPAVVAPGWRARSPASA